MEGILSLLNSYSVVILIGTIMVIAFAKCIIKIFRMGVTFKTDVVTRDELNDFEESIRKDMRGYTVQIQKIVTDASLTVINNKLKDVDALKNTAVDMKVMKAELEAEIKATMQKCNELSSLGTEVKQLSNRVQRLEYNNTQFTSNDRRSE